MLLSRGMLMPHSPNGKGEVVASSSFFAEEADIRSDVPPVGVKVRIQLDRTSSF